MKNKEHRNSNDIASATLILSLILFSSTVSAAPVQSASPMVIYAYIPNQNGTVAVIDTVNNNVTAIIPDVTASISGVYSYPAGCNPQGVAVTPDGKNVYVTNTRDNNVSVIDTATNTVIANVSVGNGPEGVAVTSDGKKVYVANYWDNTISVIDTATKTVTETVPVGSSSYMELQSPRMEQKYMW